MVVKSGASLTVIEKRGTLKSIGYLLNQGRGLKIDNILYPTSMLVFDMDEQVINLIIKTSDKECKELLNIEINASKVKGCNFDITVTILQIDVPISFIYKVERAIIDLNTHFLKRQLLIQPMLRNLRDEIVFSK